MMCKITLIDIFTGKREVLDKQMDYKSLGFDFNDATNFSPDTDSVQVARKAWDHILNPIGVDKFVEEIQSKKVMIIQKRDGFTYDQALPEDNLLSLEKVKEYIKDHHGEKAYGGDIDVVKYINGKRHTINPSCPIELDLLNDFFHT